MLDEVSHELPLIFRDEPLVEADEVVAVHFAPDDLLLEEGGPCEFLGVPEEVAEAVELDDDVFDILPLGNHYIADQVVEVVLHEAGHPQGFEDLEGLALHLRCLRLQGEALQLPVQPLPVLAYLGVGGPEVEVAVVEVHGLVQGQRVRPTEVSLNERVERCDLLGLV